jgi:glycosyltransferase involved in cell wall biosynthesis
LLARELNLGGSERQLCEMVRGLDRDRFAPHAGCFRPGGIRAREIQADRIPLAEFPLTSFRSPSNVWSSVLALRRYVRKHGVRVVHAFDAPTSLFVGLAASLLGRAVVLTSQRSSRQLVSLAIRAGLRLSDRTSDGIVVNCEAVREELLSVERVPIQRIHLCYNGLDSRRFQRTVTERSEVIPRHALVIGTACVFRPEKDLSTLLSAFAECYASNPNLFLVMVGDGPGRANLQQRALDLGISSRCLFQPPTSDVVSWLRLIDIFVLPSLFEALSNALMEAMACECACIASRVGGNPELVHDGETGLLFEEGDVRSLVGHLRRVIADPSLRQRLGRRAASVIRSRFSLQAAAARLGAIYEDRMAAQETVR